MPNKFRSNELTVCVYCGETSRLDYLFMIGEIDTWEGE